MVLSHQDAWRKHPFIANCAKKPFTGLGTAAAIFGAYLVVDTIAGIATGGSSHASHSHAASNVAYTREDVGERPTLSQ